MASSSSSCGTDPRETRAAGLSGTVCWTSSSTRGTASPENGGRRQRISYSTAPREYTSVRGPTASSSARACSGAM